jgi:tRNA pseudouridine38-40 synthase
MSFSEPVRTPSGPDARTWKLTLAYDGTDFQGWQVQPGQRTIQGELQSALERVCGESPLPQGSGRTDAGVHALAQVASFPLVAPIPSEGLRRALNRVLPPSIRILEVRPMPAGFHARRSATAKTYEYRIFRGAICSPFLARFVLPCPWRLDFKALEQSAHFFLGEHDFLSFAASDPDRADRLGSSPSDPEAENATVRTVFSSAWERRRTRDGQIWVYRVRGNGFLHHMVRNLVGTMLDAGAGRLKPQDIPTILSAHSRSAAGPTAPASGLFLHSVEYSGIGSSADGVNGDNNSEQRL